MVCNKTVIKREWDFVTTSVISLPHKETNKLNILLNELKRGEKLWLDIVSWLTYLNFEFYFPAPQDWNRYLKKETILKEFFLRKLAVIIPDSPFQHISTGFDLYFVIERVLW